MKKSTAQLLAYLWSFLSVMAILYFILLVYNMLIELVGSTPAIFIFSGVLSLLIIIYIKVMGKLVWSKTK